ncbi:MAG: arylsulfatase [bacterium]|nr:arylsulfatase [bacterium]
MYRLLSLLTVACANAATPLHAGRTLAADERPNIVILLADDMGFSDLSCYGGEIETPNLDQLANNGLRFTQAYNTSKCFPSRASLLTGAYAQAVGMDRRPAKIVNGVTLGEVLRAAGYRTLMAGKHHGTENPYERGFDRYYGLRDGACNYFNPGERREGEPQPAQKRANRAWCIDGETLKPYTPDDPDFYTTDAFTDAALGFLDDYAEEEKPFLLYVAYNAPHDPLQAPASDIAKYAGKYDAGWDVVREARYRRQIASGLFESETTPLSKADFGDWEGLSEEERRVEIRRMQVYAAMVDRLDQNVGRIVAKLEELGELDNTVVLFASDNGGSSEVVRIGTGEIGSMTRWTSLQKRWANVTNTPLRRYKNFSHEGGICTPLIVHWPAGLAERGGFERTPVHFVDVMATAIELAGARYPDGAVRLNGVSLVPLLAGEGLDRPEPIFWHWGRGKAVRDGRWKLVALRDQWELYDLDADRTETRDLAAAEPERVEQMVAKWTRWAESIGD